MPTILTPFCNRQKQFKKSKKNGNPLHCVILCDLVSRKNNKLVITQISRKSVLRNDLPCTKIHDFQAKWPMLWQNLGHIFSNDVIFCTSVHPWMANKLTKEIFIFLNEKSISHSCSAKNGFFREAPTKYLLQIGPHQFYRILDHI